MLARLVAPLLLGLALGTPGAVAADRSVEQVKAALAAAGPDRPARFDGADLSDLDLSGLDFRQASLRGANLFASRLVRANFAGADLGGANLNGAWLMGADFTGAKLAGASLLSVVVLGGEVKQMPVFERADLHGVRMIADLPGANLAGADL